MKTSSRIIAGGLAALMLAAAATPRLHAETLSAAPAPVRMAVEAFAPDIAPDAVELRKQGIGYGANFRREGVRYDLRLAPDGVLLAVGETVVYRPQRASPRNDAIGGLASLTEDLAEFAMAGEAGRTADTIARYREGLGQVRPMFDQASATALAERLAVMEAALGRQDLGSVALAATDSFRTLEMTLDKTALVVPVEVSMLDYVGFRLQSLAAAPAADWMAMKAVVDEADGTWRTLSPQVEDKGLNDLMTSVQAGLEGSIAAQDLGQLRFAAQMELDAVDLLEHHFDLAWKTGAGAVAEPANTN